MAAERYIATPGFFRLSFSRWWAVCTVSALVAGVPLTQAEKGDINRDGVIDVGDLVICANMVSDVTPADPATADMDSDGEVDGVDVVRLRELVVGNTGDPLTEVAAAQVGAAGGTIAAAGVELDIPPGCFVEERTVRIFEVDAPSPYGTTRGGLLYEIHGLGGRSDPITFRFPDTGGREDDTPAVVFGRWAKPKSYDYTWAYETEWNILRQDGHLIAELAAPSAAARRRVSRAYWPEDDAVRVKSEWELAVESGGYFEYSYDPAVVSALNLVYLDTFLVKALQRLQSAPFGFSYAVRTHWPIRVELRDLRSENAAGLTFPGWTVNGDYLQFNVYQLHERNTMRGTAAHEFLHLVQNWYGSTPQDLWLDDATSTWVEELIFPSPGTYVPSEFRTYLTAPFDRWHIEPYRNWLAQWQQAGAQNHGYGMAGVIEYLINRPDTDGGILKRIYERILAGDHPVDALFACSPTADYRVWRDEFFKDYVEGKIYSQSLGSMLLSDERLRKSWITANSPDQLTKLPTQIAILRDLESTVTQVAIDPALLDPAAVFRTVLRGEDGHLIPFVRGGSNATRVAAASYHKVDLTTVVVDVPNVRSLMEPFIHQPKATIPYRNALLLLTQNESLREDHTGSRTYTLEFAVSNPYDLKPQPLPLLYGDVGNGRAGLCPTVKTSGRMEGAFVKEIEDKAADYEGGAGAKVHVLDVKLAPPLPQAIHLTFDAVPAITSVQIDKETSLTATVRPGVYLYTYQTWSELESKLEDEESGADARLDSGGETITITQPLDPYKATAYIWIRYAYKWGGFAYELIAPRPVLALDLYTQAPRVVPQERDGSPTGGKAFVLKP